MGNAELAVESLQNTPSFIEVDPSEIDVPVVHSLDFGLQLLELSCLGSKVWSV